MNIEVAQWFLLFGVGFFSMLYWINAAKAIYALQRETNEFKHQLEELKIRVECTEQYCETLRETIDDI